MHAHGDSADFHIWKKYHDMRQHSVQQTLPVLQEVLAYFQKSEKNAPIFTEFQWKFKILIVQAIEIQTANL